MTITNQIISFKLSGISYSGTSTQLNYTAGVTAGTCLASKSLVVDSFRNITNINTLTATTLTATTLNGTIGTASQPNITSLGSLTSLSINNNLTVIGHNGSTTGLILGSTLVTATGIQLNYNNITSIGTAQASKALILDSSSNISGINILSATTLSSTNLIINGTTLTVSGTQLNYNNITTPGVAQASKTLVLNSSSNVSSINTLSATTLTATNINGTILTASQPNITSLGTLTGLVLSGTISGATNITISGTLSGSTISGTSISGTITTASQSNITSVGTLTSLNVTGQTLTGSLNATNILLSGTDITSSLSNLTSISDVTAGTAAASKALILNSSRNIVNINSLTSTALVATNITGTIQTASQPNITSLGALTTLALSGSITSLTNITMSGTISGASSISATNFNGSVNTASQPNITSLGVLTSLVVSGNTGIGTTTPSRQTEINSSTGSCLRLSFGAPTGSATNYTDFTLNSSGALTINSSNDIINLNSRVVIGKSNTSNILCFNGVTNDAGINMTVIAERIYNGNDFSELLLFKGNDGAGTSGPDRIRMRAAEMRFQIYTSGEDFTTLSDNNNALIISPSGKIGVNCDSPSQQFEINNSTGNCLRLIYNDTDGTPTVYSDINVNSSGTLTVKSTNNIFSIGDSTDTAQSLLLGTSSLTGTTGAIRILTTTAGNYIQSSVNTSLGSAADLIIGNYTQAISNSARKIIFKSDGKVGFGTSTPTRQLEINDASGNCLRLSYNAPAGSATVYCDQSISSTGVVTFTNVGTAPSFSFTNALSVTNGNITGTIGTASQPNITSVGTLTSLTLSGALSGVTTINNSGIITNANNTTSTSNTTGAIKTSGGIGISNTTDAISSTNGGTLTTAGGAAVAKKLFVGSDLTTGGALSVSGAVSILDSTVSSSTTTGALKVTGGVGIGGVAYIGGALNVNSNIFVSGNINGTLATASQTNITSVGTLSGLTSSGVVSVTNNTTSTSTTTGALKVTGGVGIGGATYIGGALSVTGNITGTLATASQPNITSIGIVDKLFSNGSIRATGFTAPSSGIGVEMHYAANSAAVFGYNRDTSQYIQLALNNSIYVLGGSGNGPFNVGIGTSSPGAGLDVSTNIRTATSVYVSDTGASGKYIGNWASSNWWAIGAHDTNTTNNLRIGISSVAGVWTGGYPNLISGAYTNASDYRIKENIKELSYGLNEIKKIRPVVYNIKKDINNKQIGFIAHEMQEIIPEVVTGKKDEVDENGNEIHQGISYANLTPLIIKGMQEHIEITNNLEEQIKVLNNENIELKNQINEIQKTLALLLQNI